MYEEQGKSLEVVAASHMAMTMWYVQIAHDNQSPKQSFKKNSPFYSPEKSVYREVGAGLAAVPGSPDLDSYHAV